jgi:hypothetical protein
MLRQIKVVGGRLGDEPPPFPDRSVNAIPMETTKYILKEMDEIQ